MGAGGNIGFWKYQLVLAHRRRWPIRADGNTFATWRTSDGCENPNLLTCCLRDEGGDKLILLSFSALALSHAIRLAFLALLARDTDVLRRQDRTQSHSILATI